MFRNLWQHVTGMVSTLRQRFQKSSGPAKGKHPVRPAKGQQTATASTQKPTKRKKSPVRAVKRA